jgi:anti-sigma factor RsiW
VDCKEAINLISAYADGELDAPQRAAAERHIGECAQCGQALESINALKASMRNDGLKFNAPGPLLKRVSSLLDKAIDQPGARPNVRPARMVRPKWIALAASVLVFAGALSAYLLLRPSALKQMEAPAVARYQQSLQANHVVDFASSDPKAVNNWFSSRLNFAPLVPLQPVPGFTLDGARVDQLAGQTVATVVYRNGSHISQIFEWPDNSGPSPASASSQGGLSVASWANSGWAFVSVSDSAGPPTEILPNIFTVEGCGPK